MLIKRDISEKYLKTQKHLQQKLCRNCELKNVSVSKLIKNWPKPYTLLYLSSSTLFTNVDFKKFNNPLFYSFGLKKSLNFLLFSHSKKLQCFEKKFSPIYAYKHIIQNSLKTVQKYRIYHSYTELFSFKFIKNIDEDIQREKKKTTNLLFKPFSGTFNPIVNLNFNILSGFEEPSSLFFKKHHKSLSKNFITFTAEAFCNQKVLFDHIVIKSQLQKNVYKEKRDFLKILHFPFKIFNDNWVLHSDIFNLSKFLKFELSEKLYKSRNRSIKFNFQRLEKVFFPELNLKRFLFFQSSLILLFIEENDNYISLWKKIKKDKTHAFFWKNLFYRCFCFFVKKIEFSSNDAFSLSVFKKTFLPFLAIEEDIIFFLKTTPNSFPKNYTFLNLKLKLLKESQTTTSCSKVLNNTLVNINNQRVRFTRYNLLYYFLSAKNSIQKSTAILQNTNRFQTSKFLNSGLEKQEFSKTKDVLKNPLIIHYFFDFLIRTQSWIIINRSQQHNRDHKKNSHVTTLNDLITTDNIKKSFKEKKFKTLFFVNKFLNKKFINRGCFYKNKNSRFLLVEIQKKEAFLIEINVSFFLFENNFFLCLLKNTIFENKSLSISKKQVSNCLKTMHLQLESVDGSFSDKKSSTSNPLFYTTGLRSLFQKKLDLQRTSKTNAIFFYKSYTIEFSKKKSFQCLLHFGFSFNYIQNLRKSFKFSVSRNPKSLMQKLNPKMYTWGYTQRFSSNEQIPIYLDYKLFDFLWNWACQRHRNKAKKWIRSKYFCSFYKNKPLFGSVSKIRFGYLNIRNKNICFQNTALRFLFVNKPFKFSKETDALLFDYLPYHLQIFYSLKKASLG